MFQVKKMKSLKNSKIQKIKEIPNGFLFDLYSKNKKNFLVIYRNGFFLSDKNYDAISPSNFCDVLRKNLMNEIIIDINQKEFDRIVEIETKKFILILEMFGNGNIILTEKPNKKIIAAIEMRAWRDRTIKRNIEYQYPPLATNPFSLTLEDFKRRMDEKEIIRILAKDLGFGGEMANKICQKLGIDPNSKNVENANDVYRFIHDIENQFQELKNTNDSLMNDFETNYHIYKISDLTEIERKTKKIRENQLKTLENLESKKITFEKYIQTIYENYLEFEEEFEKKRKSPQKEIVIKNIPFNPRKSLSENIQDYYKKIKDIKRKIEGAKKAMEKIKIEKHEIKKPEVKYQKEWYQKFWWFISSDGFVVVGGKDARSNEELIKKYVKENDLVFHTDITGSPFVVIKNPDKKRIPTSTINEAAEFCACYSKAWKIGIQADVYYILPDQVKKEGGLPKGSFMIYGKREWVRRIDLRLAMSVYEDRLIYGPISAVKKKTKNYIVIVPGEENINELFNKYFGHLSEEAKRTIPYGKCKIVETHGV